MKKLLSFLISAAITTSSISTVFASDYTTDSQELIDIMEHYTDDDADGYIKSNLTADEQEIIIQATRAAIENTSAVSSPNSKIQALIDLAVLTADGTKPGDVQEAVQKAALAGNNIDDMLAATLLCTPYNGFPRTLNAITAINNSYATAPTKSAQMIVMQIDNPIMSVDGSKEEIDPGRGTVPMIVDNRTVLPIRAFVESIGGSAEWDENTNSAEFEYKGTVIKLTIGSTTAYVNNTEHLLDVTPFIINERTMLPIRFIAENFGYKVDWNPDTQEITINNGGVEEVKTISNIFEKGELNPFSNVFTGVSYLNTLVASDNIFNAPSFNNVTFEPCTRTDWHSHDGGQILLVTEGIGLYQEEGQAARFMKPGDIIMAKPGVKHWHGASNNSWFAHIAIGTNPDNSKVNWQEKVTDDEYNAAYSQALANDIQRDNNGHIFPLGERNPLNNVFTGQSYLATLVPNEEIFNSPYIANVTFEPCTRTDWHSHDGGQILLVTEGTGLYQEEGKKAVVMKPGDVIKAEPGVKHWHGASKDGMFSHISISTNPDNSKVNWQEKVTDDEYNAAYDSVLYTGKRQEAILKNGVERKNVTFNNKDVEISGNLYLPKDFDENSDYAAIICVHPGGGVKEQVSGDYAAMLANQGYITLAYDASYQGESGGTPHYLENPDMRISDVLCAVDYLETLPYVNNERIAALGICAGGGYATKAACLDHRIKVLATVSAAQMGGGTYDEAQDSPDNYVTVIPYTNEGFDENTPQFMIDAYEYYRTSRGKYSTSECIMPYISNKYLTNFEAYDLVSTALTQPVIMVAGENALTKSYSENAVKNAASNNKKLVVIDNAYHFDLYDKPEYVDQVMKSLTSFFNDNL